MLKTLLMSSMLGQSMFSTAFLRAADEGSEPLGLIEFEDNLDDIEKPPELPANVYTGEVQDVQMQTSGKGNKYFAIKFVIPPEEIPADLQDGFPEGAVLYWNRQIVPKSSDRRALYNLRRLVEALGLDSSKNSVDPNEWMGCKAKLRVRMGTYQGEQRAEIAAVEAAEAAPTRGAQAARGAKNKNASGRASARR